MVSHQDHNVSERISNLDCSEQVATLLEQALPTFPPLNGSARRNLPSCALRSPHTGIAFAQVGAIDDDILEQLIVTAIEAHQGSWGAFSASERECLLFRFAQLASDAAQELAELETLASGRPLTAVRQLQLPRLVSWSRYLAGLATGLEGHTGIDPGGSRTLCWSFCEPAGVLVLPVTIGDSLCERVLPMLSALAAGCSVILVCEDSSYPCLYRLCSLMEDAGLPAGGLSLVWGGEQVVQQLLQHPPLFCLTETEKNECGSGRMLVFDDADIDLTIDVLVEQVLSPLNPNARSPRLHIHESIYEEFLEALTGRLQQLVLGDPLQPTTELGAPGCKVLIDSGAALLARCREQGLRVLCGGHRVAGLTHLAPTLIADDGLRLAHQGLDVPVPVLLAQPFSYPERVIRRANRDPHCFGVSLFTQRLGRVHRLSQELKADQVWVNSHYLSEPGDRHQPLAPYLRRRTLWISS